MKVHRSWKVPDGIPDNSYCLLECGLQVLSQTCWALSPTCSVQKDGLKFNFNGCYAPALFYKMYLLFICSNNLQFCKSKLSLLMMFTEHSVGGSYHVTSH